MLKKILSGEACAKCRLCCIFDRYDVWETPVFTAELCERIRQPVRRPSSLPRTEATYSEWAS